MQITRARRETDSSSVNFIVSSHQSQPCSMIFCDGAYNLRSASKMSSLLGTWPMG